MAFEKGDRVWVRIALGEERHVVEAVFVRSVDDTSLVVTAIPGTSDHRAFQVATSGVRAISADTPPPFDVVPLPPNLLWRKILREAAVGGEITLDSEEWTEDAEGAADEESDMKEDRTSRELKELRHLVSSVAVSVRALEKRFDGSPSPSPASTALPTPLKRATSFGKSADLAAALPRLTAVHHMFSEKKKGAPVVAPDGDGDDSDDESSSGSIPEDSVRRGGTALKDFLKGQRPVPQTSTRKKAKDSSISGAQTPEVAAWLASAPTNRDEMGLRALVQNSAATTEILKQMSKGRHRYQDSGSSSGEEDAGLTGKASSSRKYGLPRRLRHRLVRHPERILDDWEDHVKEIIGHRPGLPFNYRDYTTLLRKSFGPHTGLFRIHYFISVIMDVTVTQQKPLEGMARLVQLSKAVHQAALDGGRWALAAGLTGSADPLAVPTFSGLAEELEGLATYQEAMDKLTKSTKGGTTNIYQDDGQNRWSRQPQRSAGSGAGTNDDAKGGDAEVPPAEGAGRGGGGSGARRGGGRGQRSQDR